MTDSRRAPYAGVLINGRLPSGPPSVDVRDGERVRFRFGNASSSTLFQGRLAGWAATPYLSPRSHRCDQIWLVLRAISLGGKDVASAP